MLSGRDRIFNIIDKKIPDRVPIYELLISPNVIDSLHPGMTYYDFVDEYELDAVSPNTTWDAVGRSKWLDEATGVFLDRWGITRQNTGDIIPVVLEGAIKTKQDLLTFKVPDPSEEPLLKLIPDIVKRYKGKKAIFILGRDAWTGSYMLRGMTDFLIDLIQNQSMARDIIRINVDYYKEVHNLAIDMGVDFIHLVDDYAFKSGTLCSPELFERHIYPGFCEIVAEIKKQKVPCFKHSDGNIWEIIDLLVDSGIDVLGPLEPEAEMNLAKVKSKYSDKIAVMGNISCDHLNRYDKTEIRDEVKTIISDTAVGGRHILSSGNSIGQGTKPENLVSMIRACKNFGKYPIRVDSTATS